MIPLSFAAVNVAAQGGSELSWRAAVLGGGPGEGVDAQAGGDHGPTSSCCPDGGGTPAWTSEFPCFGCVLAAITNPGIACQGRVNTTTPRSQRAGHTKSPGRGLCRLWDPRPPLDVPTACVFVLEGVPFSGHHFSQMFRKFSGLRAYHDLKPRVLDRWGRAPALANPLGGSVAPVGGWREAGAARAGG